MIKFSKNLNLILLIILICKCSLCSNETFQETANFDEENADYEFEDTTIDDLEPETETDDLFKETSGEASTSAVGTSSLSAQSSLLNSDPTSLSTTLKVVKIPEFPFNTRIQMNGIVKNRRIRAVKRVLIQLDRILLIDDVNVTNIEQALLKSIGYDSIFLVTNEGNDEYSIGFTTDINTSDNSALSLDDSVLKIVQNLKRDENIIQAEAKKVGFESSIDTSKAVIFATETLVLNGITYIMICEKTLDQVLMTCQQGTVENGTINIESTSEVDSESFSNSSYISKFLLFAVTIIFSFQIIY